MEQMENDSSYNLTTNDTAFSPSLNSLISVSSSKDHLNRGNLQSYDEKIDLQDQRKQSDISIDMEEGFFSPRISHDSSITVQDDILSPRIGDDSIISIFPTVSQNQSDRPCTHILLQKNEKLEESDSEVNGCVCKSEKASQNYIVQIKSEPTTIVITRRGSTNSITAVGSCARFRAGGSDKEKSRRGKKGKKNVPEEDSKAPLTVWERKDSDAKLSSSSGESIGARSTTDTGFKRSPKHNKENYFKRLSSRLSESARGRKAPRSSHASSPHHKRDMADEELKIRFSKAFVPKDPRFFGPGHHKHAYEGEGEENANKSEGSNKREGRSKSFSKGKPRRTPSRSASRTRARSKSKSPKRGPSKTRKLPRETPSEPFYIQQPLTPSISYQSISRKPSFAEDTYPKRAYAAENQHQYSQTDPYSSPFEIPNKPGPLCCTCGMPTLEKRDTYIETPIEEPKKPAQEPESKPRRKMVLSVRSDVRSTTAYDAVVELEPSEMPGFESYPHDTNQYVAHRDQPPGPLRRAPSFEQPVTEEQTHMHAPKSPNYRHAGSQCSGPIYDHPPPDQYYSGPTYDHPPADQYGTGPTYDHSPADQYAHDSATRLSHSPPLTSPPRSRQPSITDHGTGSKEAIAKHPVEPEEDAHVPKSPRYQPPYQPSGPAFDHSSADQHQHGSDRSRKVEHARGHDEAYAQPAWHKQETSSHRRGDTINVYCRHCGCGLQTIPGDMLKDPSRPPPKDDNVSHVLWVLAKITVFKDGTRNFEILESTSIPPGHYLMPGNEEFLIVAGNR